MTCDGVVEDSHEWGPDRRFVSHAGATDGTWFVSCCLHCNAGRIAPSSGGDGLELLVAALAAAGCDPRPLGAAS
jgi:hypothetical protein